MTTLSEQITAAQILLGDPTGTKYTTDILTEAFRQSLSWFDMFFPQVLTETITLDSTDRIVELDTLINCKQIISIIHPVDAPNQEKSFSPPFYSFFKGAIPWLQFTGTYIVSIGDQFVITYTSTNWIDGLDDAVATTVPWDLLPLLTRGAVAIAKGIRSSEINEPYGNQGPESTRLLDQHEREMKAFRADLLMLKPVNFVGFPGDGFPI